ncbi:Headcase -like protein [Halotydeus destructor]|nr:Headcase -like protein [Halotydeus destructor]
MPNRNSGHRAGGGHHEPLLEEPEEVNHHYQNNNQQNDRNEINTTKCCSPDGCDTGSPIKMEDLHDVVKVICNNDQCQEGRYMHKSCFESWEESVLTFLRSCGRARSWSEKQRHQNLWTKKGYDLAFKACGCKCTKGHLRKDLDWLPPAAVKGDEAKKKKKGKKSVNQKPVLTIVTSAKPATKPLVVHDVSPPNGHAVHHGQRHNSISSTGSSTGLGRNRTSSMSSTGSANSGGTSPIFGSETPSPDIQTSSIKKLLLGTDCHLDNSNHHSHNHHGVTATPRPVRERQSSGSIFSRRSDYSNFNSLPKHKINSYHIKMEDDSTQDDTRNFLLAAFSSCKVNRTQCVLCQSTLPIFDRYPLIDGTFFLSPRQHSKSSLPVKHGGRGHFLNAVCMGCLEGWNMKIKCRGCKNSWNGSHLVLGTMYTYDIFAAVPCCVERLRCNSCQHLVISPERRLQFFSDYSHSMACGHCKTLDHHFVKPLALTFSPA